METPIAIKIPEHVLSFSLDQEFFAVNVTKVIEIIEVPKISKIPKAPAYMSGVINVRKHMVPLVDTRVKLGMSATAFSVDTCVIVVEINANGQRLAVGVLVDEVLEVIDLTREEILPPPKFESNDYERFITGMFSVEEHYAMILDLDQIFSLHEVIALESVTQAENEKKDQTTKRTKQPAQ
ncbi:purine-binding chemotaxis protein CheW [Reichenbachiella agariperforans]|uniref:Purine-binding chemotaxis protein CheW n=1 Tax=Reichenbachiella agariperforans TaxID=156994 RepID=A0A1M6T0J8_REIAG|nr:chemotaxis protein CheW [Reichenbachiella agariperforans]SHK50455.1 purine-binding chemotaxis protein CheW [Reichenbachiella agariperforans]